MSGQSPDALPCMPRCITRESKPDKHETEVIHFEHQEKDWDMLANAELDKVQQSFQQQNCNYSVGIKQHMPGHCQ